MKIVYPRVIIPEPIDGRKMLRNIERYARISHKSEDKITDGSAEKLVRNLVKVWGHESVLEHEKITVIIVCDRGISHEIVRHRIASYTQESTRYCNYSRAGKFGKEITVIFPYWYELSANNPELHYRHLAWLESVRFAEVTYMNMINHGATPEEARNVLPNSLKTEIAITANLREWRHFFKLRTSKAANPQMREIAIPLLAKFKELVPVIFDDIPIPNLVGNCKIVEGYDNLNSSDEEYDYNELKQWANKQKERFVVNTANEK